MKDNFSNQANSYARYRPEYPRELYEFIFSKCVGRTNSLDCATGNGQVAKVLAAEFEQVYATDISANQIRHAYKASNIEYHILNAENTIFKNDFFDLITVGQALHWFDFEPYFQEVKRTLKPSGVFAAWGYRNMSVSKEIDDLNSDFYHNITGPYWDDERIHVDNQYASIDFPFDNVESKSFTITKKWTLEDLEGFLNTWSAVQHFVKKEGYSPIPDFINRIARLWGKGEYREVRFPIFLKAMTR